MPCRARSGEKISRFKKHLGELCLPVVLLLTTAACSSVPDGRMPSPPIVRVHTDSANTPCCSISTEIPEFNPTISCAHIVLDWISSVQTDFTHKAVPPEKGRPKNELTITLDRQISRGSFLSLKFNVCEYLGGAHPNVYPETFVLDLKTGTRILLPDLFVSTDSALAEISRISICQLEAARETEMTPMEKGGLLPAINNFRYFTLEETGLAFFFPVYQTGPRSLGEQTATLPYRTIRQRIKPAILKGLNRNL